MKAPAVRFLISFAILLVIARQAVIEYQRDRTERSMDPGLLWRCEHHFLKNYCEIAAGDGQKLTAFAVETDIFMRQLQIDEQPAHLRWLPLPQLEDQIREAGQLNASAGLHFSRLLIWSAQRIRLEGRTDTGGFAAEFKVRNFAWRLSSLEERP